MSVTKWYFHLLNISNGVEHLNKESCIDVMPKRNAVKKGFACRLNCSFVNANEPVLDFVAEHS